MRIKQAQGFTLIEILIVIFIIGLISSTVIIKIGSTTNYNQIKNFTELLKSQIHLARIQAILERQLIGLSIHTNSYEFYQYNKKLRWIPLNQKDNFWAVYKTPTGMSLHVKTKNGSLPQIIFLPSGEMTPFKISIAVGHLTKSLELLGSEDGSITLPVSN